MTVHRERTGKCGRKLICATRHAWQTAGLRLLSSCATPFSQGAPERRRHVGLSNQPDFYSGTANAPTIARLARLCKHGRRRSESSRNPRANVHGRMGRTTRQGAAIGRQTDGRARGRTQEKATLRRKTGHTARIVRLSTTRVGRQSGRKSSTLVVTWSYIVLRWSWHQSAYVSRTPKAFTTVFSSPKRSICDGGGQGPKSQARRRGTNQHSTGEFDALFHPHQICTGPKRTRPSIWRPGGE